MFSPPVISSIGLVLDIFGCIMLFIFGLPPDVSRHGRDSLATSDADPKEQKKAKLYDILSWFALFLLVFGFLLQLSANLMQIDWRSWLMRLGL